MTVAKQKCFCHYIVLQSHFSSRLCNRVERDVCVDSKQNVCLMGVKQIKNGNLVAANLKKDMKKDLQLKSKTFRN